MARMKARGAGAQRPGGFTNWLNRTLFPWIGPPPLGPYDDVPKAEVEATKAAATCPICGSHMSLHEIDRSGERTMVRHPAADLAG